MVTVIVGTKERCFEVHDTLLEKSEYIQNLFDKSSEQGGRLVLLRLPEQEPITFAWFVHWLYTQQLKGYFYPTNETPNIEQLRRAVYSGIRTEPSEPETLVLHYGAHVLGIALVMYRDAPLSALVHFYILANDLRVHGLKDIIISTLIETYGSTGEIETEVGKAFMFWKSKPRRPLWLERPAVGINLAWKNLPAESVLCKAIVSLACDNHFLAEPGAGGLDGVNEDFMVALHAKTLKRNCRGKGTTAWERNGKLCKLHEHESDIPCKVHRNFLGGISARRPEWFETNH